MPENTNTSPKPPTGLWKITLLLLARAGGKGAALERWALKRLRVWPETDSQGGPNGR